MNPKVIFFDWNKTLSDSLFWSNLRDSNHQHNQYVSTIEKSIFFDNRQLINPWMRGEYSSEDICQIIANKSGVPYEVVFNGLKESCAIMKLVSEEIPGLVWQIKAKGIKTVIATDNMDTFSRFTIPALDLTELFDDFLISYNLKLLKGDVQEDSIPFFDGYLKQNSLNYSDVVLLDDCIDMGEVYNRLDFKIIEITGKDKLINVLREYAA
ncbi:MAG: hypothetical protein WCP18_02740 [bacterium]